MVMFYLTQGQANTVILTLTEKSVLTNPYYLFCITNDQLNSPSYFIASDTSIYKDRYNQFSITEKSNPNPLNGEVSLPIAGDYHYTVYEQTSATNINPAQSGGIVETGRLTVTGSSSSTPAYTGTTTNTAYNG